MADGVEDELGALLEIMAPVFSLELAGPTSGGTCRAAHVRGVEFEVVWSGTFDRIEMVTHNSSHAIHVLSFEPIAATTGDTINLKDQGQLAAMLYKLIERGAFRNDQVRPQGHAGGDPTEVTFRGGRTSGGPPRACPSAAGTGLLGL